MPHKLIVTKPAQDDINQIFEYVAKDNPTAAITLVDAFEHKFNILSEFPNSGFRPAFAKSNVRFWLQKIIKLSIK